MSKRSALVVAAGLVVSLSAGFSAFANGTLGPALSVPTTRIPRVTHEHPGNRSLHRATETSDVSGRAKGAAGRSNSNHGD